MNECCYDVTAELEESRALIKRLKLHILAIGYPKPRTDAAVNPVQYAKEVMRLEFPSNVRKA